jgi:hypothetical protein
LNAFDNSIVVFLQLRVPLIHLMIASLFFCSCECLWYLWWWRHWFSAAVRALDAIVGRFFAGVISRLWDRHA